MRYRIGSSGGYHTATFYPIPAIEISGHADDPASAVERAAASVEALGNSPLGLIPQVAAAAAAAKVLGKVIRVGKAQGAEGVKREVAKLPDRAKQAVSALLAKVF